MRFTKMHGLGNDFIIVNAISDSVADPAALAQRLCRRYFDIGADGLILICPSPRADAMMRIFNSDGSEPEMCGNGIRCAAKYLYDSGLVPNAEMTIDTLAGVKTIQLTIENGRAALTTVDMGVPEFAPARIPVAAAENRLTLSVGGQALTLFCVSMGNPHAVCLDFYPDDAEFFRLGALIERDPAFPARTNVEFVRIDSPKSASVRVWERGDGPTLACGTGSCAVLAAGVSLGRLERTAEIHLPGGTLTDEWREADGHIYMTGPAVTVCTGEFE